MRILWFLIIELSTFIHYNNTMPYIVTRRTAARLIFFVGFLLMILGSTFLIGSLRFNISQISVLISFLLVFFGVTCAVLATRLNRRSLYVFFAALFVQAGLFLFLHAIHIIPVRLSQTWPLLSVFAGMALFPAGWRRYGAPKITYIIPSITFVGLGSALMVFSLNLVSFSFAQFIQDWWPLLVVLAGLTLVLSSLGVRVMNNDQ